jgi:response regulator of citrate/malate metabolism
MYNSKEVAEILNVSDKSVRRYLTSYFSIENGAYQVSEKMLGVLKSEYLGQSADNLRTGSDKDVQEFEDDELINEIKKELADGNVIEVYTPEKYEVLENTLKDYENKSIEINKLETKIKYLDKEIVGLVQDKFFLQSQLDKSRDALTQNQWVLAKYINEKNP